MRTLVAFVLVSFLPVAIPILSAATISNVITSPTSPAALNYGNYLTFDFDYSVDEDSRIFGRPMYNGVRRTDYGAHPSPLYPAGTSGSATGWFTLWSSQPVALVDEIYFQIMDSTATTVLFEHFEPVEHAFLLLGDMNNDGAVNGLDVAPFVDAVISGGGDVAGSAVPEPSTLLLVTIALLGLLCRRRH